MRIVRRCVAGVVSSVCTRRWSRLPCSAWRRPQRLSRPPCRQTCSYGSPRGVCSKWCRSCSLAFSGACPPVACCGAPQLRNAAPVDGTNDGRVSKRISLQIAAYRRSHHACRVSPCAPCPSRHKQRLFVCLPRRNSRCPFQCR